MDKEIYNKNTDWYIKTYYGLISKAKLRGLNKKSINYYTERHHITPKCIGGTDDVDNLVLLTYKEHIVAHRLLSRIYDTNIKLKHVVYLMINSPKNKYIHIHSLSQLEEIRVASIEYLRAINTGKTCSPETRRKISESKSNKKLSEYAKSSMAAGRVGMVFTEERKRKISEAMKGKIVSEETRKKQSISQSPKVQGPDGTIYESTKECARILNISLNTVYRWINHTPEKGYRYISYSNSTKVIDPDGEIHSSIRKCALKYNREPKTIKNWIERYPEKGFSYYNSKSK